MRKFKVITETGFANCTHEEIIEIEDNLTDDEIEAELQEVAFDHIEWNYTELNI